MPLTFADILRDAGFELSRDDFVKLVQNDRFVTSMIFLENEDTTKLTELYAWLKLVGADPRTHANLFVCSASDTKSVAGLTSALKILHRFGATPTAQHNLYEETASIPAVAKKLTLIFMQLAALNIRPNKHAALYRLVVDNAGYAQDVPEVFRLLLRNNITVDKNLKILESVVLLGVTSDRVSDIMRALSAQHIVAHAHPALLQLLIDKDYFTIENISHTLSELAKFDITPDKNPTVFYAIFEKAYHHPQGVAITFKTLKKFNINYEKHPAIYMEAWQQTKRAENLDAKCDALISFNIEPSSHPDLFKIGIARPYDEHLNPTLTLMKRMGVTADQHPTLVHAILERSSTKVIPILFETLANLGATVTQQESLYLAVAKTAYSDTLASTLTLVSKLGISPTKHPTLVETIIRRQKRMKFALKIIKVLASQFGIDVNQHTAIYDAIAKKANYSSDRLLDVFSVFASHGANPDEHQDLYVAAVNQTKTARSLPDAVATLSRLGFNCVDHENLYLMIINNGYIKSEKLNHAFAALRAINITYAKHPTAVAAMFHTAYHTPSAIQSGTETLLKLGITLNNYPELFIAGIDSPLGHADLPTIFKPLRAMSATYDNHAAVYIAAMSSEADTEEIQEALQILAELGISVEDHAQSLAHLIAKKTSVKLMISVYDQLRQAGYQKPDHDVVYNAILNALTSSTNVDYKVLNITQSAIQFANQNKLCSSANDPHHTTQMSQLAAHIKDINSPLAHLTAGPLPHSTATIELERVLNKIGTLEPKKMNAYYDTTAGFILEIPGESEIHLSLLLRNANLSQLALSDTVRQQLGSQLNDLLPKTWHAPLSITSSPFLHQFPDEEIKAYSAYFTGFYTNINKLFRGEKLFGNNDFQDMFEAATHYLFANSPEESPNGTKNIMACLLLGCLVNNATARLNTLAWETKEAQVLHKIALSIMPHSLNEYVDDKLAALTLFSKSKNDGVINQAEHAFLLENDQGFRAIKNLWGNYETITRYELLNDEVKAQRQAGVWTLPALTSTSVAPDGLDEFNVKGSTKTILHNTPTSVILNQVEKEILMNQSLQMVSALDADGALHTYVVNSPNADSNHYASDLALHHAWKNHLSKDYKDVSHTRNIGGVTIARPNHGPPHTYRVMTYLQLVTDYFAQHAKDVGFKTFCQQLSSSDIESLRIAAAFSVTGRESEVSVHKNLTEYELSREAAARNFLAYAQTTTMPKQEQDRLAHIVRYMGNPWYEASSDSSHPVINTHEIDDERLKRTYMQRLLATAHKLDLPRCYDKDEFAKAMHYCLDLSQSSDQQLKDYYAMVRYSINLNLAHGDCVQFGLTPNNELVPAGQHDYQPIFGEANTSMKRLSELTNTVPKPRPRAAVTKTDTNTGAHTTTGTSRLHTLWKQPAADKTPPKTQDLNPPSKK